MFVLSGEDLTLPKAETRALIETYSDQPAFETTNRRLVLSSLGDSGVVKKITERGAYTRFGGIVIGKSAKLESTLGDFDFDFQGSFAVDSYNVDKSLCGELGHLIKSKTENNVDLENPQNLFQIEKVDSDFVVGLSGSGYKRFSWKSRRPRARRFFLPSAIYPKFARDLVNLARVREGDIFLDPFCGTGSLLIEAALMGMRSVGVDLKRWIAQGALLNLKFFGLDYESILRADSGSKFFPFRNVDAISTDVPYGRASSTMGKGTAEIIGEFMNSA